MHAEINLVLILNVLSFLSPVRLLLGKATLFTIVLSKLLVSLITFLQWNGQVKHTHTIKAQAFHPKLPVPFTRGIYFQGLPRKPIRCIDLCFSSQLLYCSNKLSAAVQFYLGWPITFFIFHRLTSIIERRLDLHCDW